MNRRILSLKRSLLGVLLLLGGCQASPRPSTSESVLPIVGGSQASTCQWPSTVMLIGPWVCTGTLVHPRAVVTAKHCLMDEAQTVVLPPRLVGFGENRQAWARTARVAACYVHPDHDIGLCVLEQDVTGIPTVPVMAACESSELLPGRPIVEVGFGVTSATGTTYGTKKWINGTIERLSANQADILVTTGSQNGEYFGDSGGPLFFRMPDLTWRLIGEDCCSDDIGDAGPRISTYTSVPYHVSWMEERSGLDLTPCHDSGGWAPGANCTGFPTNPGIGVGTWNNQCQGETMARVQTCAASPFDASLGGDLREVGNRDTAPDISPAYDLALSDGLDSLATDSLGPRFDGLDLRPDVSETGGPLPGVDAASPAVDTRADMSLPPDGAAVIDGAQAPGDTGMLSLDTAFQEVSADLDGPTGQDSRALVEMAISDASQQSGDSANDRGGQAAHSTAGCSCRSGGSTPTGGWSILVSFGLLWTLGRSRRRRYLQ